MSDYTQVTDFSVKDSLSTGDPLKLIKGSDVDAELDAISTAIATKYDSSDIASQAQAQAETSDAVLMTPLRTAQWADANGGMVGDIQALADPGADAVLGWDDSAGAAIGFTLAAGLNFSGTEIVLDFDAPANVTPAAGDEFVVADASDSGNPKAVLFSVLESTLDHDSLSGVDANEHVDHTGVTLSAGTGISGTGLGDISASRTINLDTSSVLNVDHSAVTITAGTGLSGGGTIESTRTLDLDISSLTNMDISETAGVDSVLVNDNGTMKQMDIRDGGVRVVEETAAQTFAAGDANTLQLLTGSTDRSWVIPDNASVAYHIGAVIYVGSRDTAEVTLDPASGVTLTSILQSSNGDQIVQAGGLAVLIKVDTDEWQLSGDISL